MTEHLFIKSATGNCETCNWTNEALRIYFISTLRERHFKGGLNVCIDCLKRAKHVLEQAVVKTNLRK